MTPVAQQLNINDKKKKKKKKQLAMCQYDTDAPTQGHPHPHASILQKHEVEKKGHNSYNNWQILP